MEILILSKNWYWFLILTVAGLSVGVYSYRKSYPPLGRLWRILLAAFRGMATVLLGLLLIEPLINSQTDRTVKSRLAVLIDDTSSMGIKSGDISRIELADSLLAGELPDVNYRYDFYTFSGAESESNLFPKVDDLSGDATSISAAFKMVESSKKFYEYGALLLVTDGRNNLGSDPVERAANLNIPIHTLTVGEEIAESNVTISGLTFPSVAYAGDRFKIEAEISGRGLRDGKSRLFIKEGEEIVESKVFDVPSEGRTTKIEFEIEAAEPGNIEYRISTPILENETKMADNERIFMVRVLKSKVNVFLGASSLNWEFKFIKQALEQFEEFSVDAVYPETPGRFSAPGVPRGLSDLGSYDVVIFVDCSPGELRLSVNDLKSYLAEGKSIVYMAGNDFSSNVRQFGELLPLEVRNISIVEDEFFFEPPHGYRQHSAISLSENPDESDRLWGSLPPLSAIITGIKSRGETLMEGRSATRRSVAYPVLTSAKFEKGRVTVITGFPIWRSYFASANIDGLSDLIPRFWKNLIRWTSSTETDEKFRIFTDQKVYRLGEPIKFTGYLNDESNSPQNGALITVSIRPEGERLKFKDALLAQTDNGIYKGELESPGTGEYEFEATALSYGDTMGVFSGEFTVESFSLEMASSVPDYELTRRIAEVTGGTAYNTDNINDFSERLKLNPYVETELSQIRIFGMPVILAIILILLCTEWGLRKKFRLP
jgi:hypothetical protein